MRTEYHIPALGELLARNAALAPDRPAVLQGETSLSQAELHDQSAGLAAWLVERGFAPGDRLAVFMHKSPEAVIAFLGAALAGGVFFSLDWNLPGEINRKVLEETRPKVVVVEEDFLPCLERARPLEASYTLLPLRRGNLDGLPWKPLSRSRGVELPEVDPNSPVYLNFTSGTTGAPKAAVTTHANLHWNNRAACEAFELTPEDVHLCMMPIYVHPHELIARPIHLGGTLVLEEHINPRAIAKAIERHKVSCLMAVASIYETLTRMTDNSHDLSSLRIPESGGMHVPALLVEKFRERFGRPILPVWGSTETSGIALATLPREDYRQGAMGRVCPHYSVKIVDAHSNELPDGETGEMLIEGPGVCNGYLSPAPDNAPLAQGRFYSRDVAWRDKEGIFHFLGRTSGMMKVGGIKVYPTEIEDVLRLHPDVLEVVVVKIEDKLRGEAPRAFIVPRHGSRPSTGDLRRFCERRLHRNKAPRHFEFLKELPRTPGGKIAWKVLISAA